MTESSMDVLIYRPAWQGVGSPFRHTFSSIVNIDQFRWLVRSDVRRQLKMARDEIGARYVRACAMYSPELRVRGFSLADWDKAPADRNWCSNWQNVDYCLDGLIELGLKPIYTTCFMPGEFTDSGVVCWRDGNHVGMPRDLVAWSNFVEDGLRHHVDRYGIDEVRSWRFECWNEPNLRGFFDGDFNSFVSLWAATWRAIKSVDPDLQVGGPSTARGEWLIDFVRETERRYCPPDYLISHVYNNDSDTNPTSPFDGLAVHRVKDSPHFASGVVRGVRRSLDELGWRGGVHWNEWGRSWFPCDPLRETAIEAAFIVKTIDEVSQFADEFAYWCLSDIYDQVGYQTSEFQGNYGMLSLHGFRKPAWSAHVLLSRLGSWRVPVDGVGELNGAIATQGCGGRCVLVWNYPEHGRVSGGKRRIDVLFPPGEDALRVIRLGGNENNCVARWRLQGAPDYPNFIQLTSLLREDVLLPAGNVDIMNGADGRIVRFELECPGVALIDSGSL